MNWNVEYLPEADKDLDSLTRQQQILVKKAIKKVQENPLPQSEGGYGKPLGHKHGLNLTNLLKIKLRGNHHGIYLYLLWALRLKSFKNPYSKSFKIFSVRFSKQILFRF